MCSSSSPVRMRTSSPVASLAAGGRHVAARRGRLPGEAGARPAERRAPRGPRAADGLGTRASRAPPGVRRGEEGQHEDVAVPEHVTAVGRAAEPARADRRLAARRPTPSDGRARSALRAAARDRPRSRRRPPASGLPTPRGARAAAARSRPAPHRRAPPLRLLRIGVVGAEPLEDRRRRGRGTGRPTRASAAAQASRCAPNRGPLRTQCRARERGEAERRERPVLPQQPGREIEPPQRAARRHRRARAASSPGARELGRGRPAPA